MHHVPLKLVLTLALKSAEAVAHNNAERFSTQDQTAPYNGMHDMRSHAVDFILFLMHINSRCDL